MKPVKLVEYNLRSIFLEKSHTKFGTETIPRPFSKKSKLSISLWINILMFYIFCFYYLPSWRLSKVIETKLQTTCFNSYKAFLKNKKSSGTSFPASFSAWFLKKNIFVVKFYYLNKFQCLLCLYFERYYTICVL